MTAKRILVAGATGYLGGYVVREAATRKLRVRALARSESKLEAVADLVDEIVCAEATEAQSLVGICDGVDWVFSSLGITRQTDRVSYDDVDYGANLSLLREAERSGCARFVYVSVLHPEHTIHTDMVAAKERFVAALRESSIESVVIRPTGFFSDMGEILAMAKSGRCYLFGDGSAKINPIHGADLAAVCLDAFEGADELLEVGGPEVLTQRQIAELAFSTLGKRPKLTKMPLWLVGGSMWVVKIFSRRRWNVTAFVFGACRNDMVGPQVGEHRLGPWFTERVAAADSPKAS